MASIIDNFVSVNIKRHKGFLTSGRYNTAVYVVGTTNVDEYYALDGSAAGTGTKTDPKAPDSTDPMMKTFFDNGGQILHKISSGNLDWEDLPIDEIVAFKQNAANPSAWPGGSDFEYPEGKYQKIFIVPATSTTTLADAHSGLAAKYTSNAGACTSVAAAAAYFTKINLLEADSVKDYAFTAETVATGDVTSDSDTIKNCITNNINCNALISGKVRNIGGNDSVGEGLTNLFMRIVLQQELANNIMAAIAGKIKYDELGKSILSATIANTMSTFINNGYIYTQKVWTDPDLYIDGEKVIATNTPLVGGYVIHISPFNSLTNEERKKGIFPNITILYGDFMGIRKVTIAGEVF